MTWSELWPSNVTLTSNLKCKPRRLSLSLSLYLYSLDTMLQVTFTELWLSRVHDFLYPTQTKFGGYIGITLSCRIHLSDLDNISHNCCPWPKGVSWPDPRSYLQGQGLNAHIPKIRVLAPSLPSLIWITFCTIVVHDPRVCHDLYTRIYLQGQGDSAHMPKIRVQAITPHCQVGSG